VVYITGWLLNISLQCGHTTAPSPASLSSCKPARSRACVINVVNRPDPGRLSPVDCYKLHLPHEMSECSQDTEAPHSSDSRLSCHSSSSSILSVLRVPFQVDRFILKSLRCVVIPNQFMPTYTTPGWHGMQCMEISSINP